MKKTLIAALMALAMTACSAIESRPVTSQKPHTVPSPTLGVQSFTCPVGAARTKDCFK